MKARSEAILLAVAGFGLLVLLAGCQTAGSSLTTTTSATCPQCRCTDEVNPAVAGILHNYVGDEIGGTVCACDHSREVCEQRLVSQSSRP